MKKKNQKIRYFRFSKKQIILSYIINLVKRPLLIDCEFIHFTLNGMLQYFQEEG